MKLISSAGPWGRLFGGIVVLGLTLAPARADVLDAAAEAQRGIETAIVELYGGEVTPETWNSAREKLQSFTVNLQSEGAKKLWAEGLPATVPAPAEAGNVLGQRQALLQHVYALEMLDRQGKEQLESAREWRALIQLPKYADAVQGVLALQHGKGAQRDAVGQLLAREYLVWQTTLIREKADALHRLIQQKRSTPEMLATRSSEIQTLAEFPPALVSIVIPGSAPAPSESTSWRTLATADEAGLLPAFDSWSAKIRRGLPNLLTPEDVTRRERLLIKLLKLVPVEYAAGVRDGEIVIPIEYREAETFTIQSRQILDELRAPWERSRGDTFTQYEPALRSAIEKLEAGIQAKADSSVVEHEASTAVEILADNFGISLRRQGKASEVIAETLLDIRTLLSESHAAARAGKWADAESLRLEAYTTFDLEIESRTMPRDPDLALRTERLFLDGTKTQPGIKAALDARASGSGLAGAYEAALAGMNECGALLQMSISPLTAIYTTISVVTREGLEAVVILAALLAGLRGGDNKRIRRNIGIGVFAALIASVITFIVSRLIITSLSRYGESLEAVVSVLAVIVLLIVTNWVFHKMYWVEWNAKLRSLTKAVNTGGETASANMAMIGVGFLTIYREGFETVLFLQSLLLEAGLRPVLIGLSIGLTIVGGLGLGVFYIGAKLPYRRLLVITGVLVITVLVTFLGSTVRLFQTVGWMPIHPITWLDIPTWMGTWLGLYPSWQGLMIPPLGLVYVGAAWLYVKWRSARTQAALANSVGRPVAASAP
ncbi:MAG TPA: FTR1 family protein [Verrucomicrobium sp.]|nr:FTR1 family protein [Verrucomicrobium sp.]